MKALVTIGDKTVELKEMPYPTLVEGEILVAPIYTGICGTDIEVINGKLDPNFVRYPVILGHEWVGRVVTQGLGVIEPAVGSRIVVTGVIPCNKCSECLIDATNRCLSFSEIGFTRPGAAAEFVAVPAFLAHVVADSVSMETAVLAEPTAVVAQAFMKATPKVGARILIIGDGTIGMIAASLARTFNPEFVHMLGQKAGQANLAKKAGVDKFMIEPNEDRYDLIFEAAGSADRITDTTNQLIRGGTLLLVGYPGFGVMVPLMIDNVVNGDLNIFGSFSSTLKSWKKAVSMMNSGELDLSYLVTHKFSLEQYGDALDALMYAPAHRGKVVLVIGNK